MSIRYVALLLLASKKEKKTARADLNVENVRRRRRTVYTRRHQLPVGGKSCGTTSWRSESIGLREALLHRAGDWPASNGDKSICPAVYSQQRDPAALTC